MTLTRSNANDTRSQAEQAFERLESLLVTLALPPGAPVLEKELVERVGLGRTPVREAVQRLAAQGLIQVLPRRGMFVAPVLRSELSQVVEVRRVLERLMVVKAAERASPDQRQALRALAVHLEHLGEDLEAFFRIDHRLDQLLVSACGNRHLANALAPLHSHCRRLWYLNRERLRLGDAVRFHASLARAVAEGDSAGAARSLNGIISVLEDGVAALDTLG